MEAMSIDSDINDGVPDQTMNTETQTQRRVISVVPWYNAAQFKKVYQCLYDDDVTNKRWALDQISVWETRCHPSLPAAIEASYGITSAVVQDILWSHTVSLNTQLDIQSIYSSAITRFVNLTVDIHEEHLLRGATMTNIAKGLGIPQYIVDLRNEASHSNRPSLPCLRLAAEEAMQYLRDSYWEKEASRVKNLVKKPIDELEIRQLLCEFMKGQLRILCNRQKMSPQDDSQAKSELQKIVQKMNHLIKKNKRLFVKVLTLDGVFIPHEEDFKFMVTDEGFKQFQGVNDDSDVDSSYDADKSNIIPAVPDFHEAIWRPVIMELNKFDAVPILMESLLKTQGDRKVFGQKLIISWVLRILRINSVSARRENSSLRKIFKLKGIVPSWKSMFYSAVVNPCKYTPYVLPMIIIHLNLTKSCTDNIMTLVAIRLGQTKDNYLALPKNPTIFTVERLHKNIRLQKAKKQIKKEKNLRKKECVWSLVSDDSHKTWPIGHIINPISNEEDEDHVELDIIECFFEDEEPVEKFIFGNKNDSEEEYIERDERLDNFHDDAMEEFRERKSFLYTK